MTGYDPFSYGQVRLGSAGSKAPEGNPDDILFADAGPGPARSSSPGADPNWELLEGDPQGLLPGGQPSQSTMDFASEVLGEAGPAAPPRARAAAPAAPPRSAPAARPRPVAPAAPVAAARPREKLVPAVRHLPADLRTGGGTTALVVSLGVAAVGGTVAAWLATLQENMVMAGIVGAGSLVAAAFCRVLLRR